jgi:hypothetical protein
MPTRFPEMRPHRGLNRWHVAGVAIGFCASLLLLAWMVSNRGEAVSGGELLPGITTGIAPSDASGE